MNFNDFKTDFNSLSEIDKNYLIKDSKHIFYKKISKVIKDSNLFTKDSVGEYTKSSELISYNYLPIGKEILDEPKTVHRFQFHYGSFERIPKYDSFGKQIGMEKEGDPILEIRISFSWKNKHIISEKKGTFFKTTVEKEVFSLGGHSPMWLIEDIKFWKSGIVSYMEKESDGKINLSKKEKDFLIGIENCLTETTKELLKIKQEKNFQKSIENKERIEKLDKNILDISKEFDTDSDGIIDFNQGQDDFMNLLKKHQVSIIDIDQNHITKFIQVSNYLKIKRENIQKQFEKIKTSKNLNQLKEFTGVLKNQIDTFNLLSYNSMIMIISLVEKDLLTFNEIYLTFDKLNIFNSNWENEVSIKLENIGSKLDDLIFSINKMEISITNEILKMSIMNQINLNRLNKTVSQGNMVINDSLKSLNSSLSSNLKSIGSKINLNNLLTGINTYQLYTLNKNTKSLRS